MKYNKKIVTITGSKKKQVAMVIEFSSLEGSGGFEHKKQLKNKTRVAWLSRILCVWFTRSQVQALCFVSGATFLHSYFTED